MNLGAGASNERATLRYMRGKDLGSNFARERLNDGQRLSPRRDGARYLFENFNRAVCTEVCFQTLGVMADTELVGVRLKLSLRVRRAVSRSGHVYALMLMHETQLRLMSGSSF